MRELDELLINVLQEAATKVAFRRDVNNPKTVTKIYKPVVPKGQKIVHTEYGTNSIRTQSVLEKIHRKMGAMKAKRTFAGKGPSAARKKAIKQQHTMKIRHNQGF